MKGSYLTKNIQLKATCLGSHCVFQENLSIKQLEQKEDKSCPECGSTMKIEDEFIIIN